MTFINTFFKLKIYKTEKSNNSNSVFIFVTLFSFNLLSIYIKKIETDLQNNFGIGLNIFDL